MSGDDRQRVILEMDPGGEVTGPDGYYIGIANIPSGKPHFGLAEDLLEVKVGDVEVRRQLSAQDLRTLKEAGYSAGEIVELRQAGVL
jgi:hypothetical protein